MSLEEKFWQLFMIPGDFDDPAEDWSHGVFGLQVRTGAPDARRHAERVNAIQRRLVEQTRLGIPMLPFEEALHGVLMPGATVFPQAIALAASWDTALVARVAAAIARESRSRGIRQVLSPVVNLASDVRWGRTEETYGEDPFLAGLMGGGFVAAFERAGVVATPKHFVANVGDGGRDSYPIALNTRALEELHFPPFRAALDAGARSVMTAYNSVDGSPATQNRWLLTTLLREAWKFPGFVISDQAGTGGATVLHRTEASTATAAQHALEAGLDVIFQSSWPQHRPYLEAFRRGLIAPAIVDSAVARVLRVKLALGLFEQPYTDPDSAAHWNGHASHLALAREASRAGIVLLKNDALLPLPGGPRRIAVIGPDAAEPRFGGYSGPGIRPVAILAALRERRGVQVDYEPGPGRDAPVHRVIPAEAFGAGLTGEYFDNPEFAGSPIVTRSDRQVDFLWTFNPPVRGLRTDWYAVRWTGTVTAPAGGVGRIGVEGSDGFRVWLDDRLILDNWRKQSHRALLAQVNLAGGGVHRLRLEYHETTGNARVRLIWDAGIPDHGPALDRAVALARGSDVAVVVAGIEEGEFRDRASLALPGRQEELILRVAETGTPVVVVLIGGSAITMSRWLDRVPAVLMAWYPGEQGGHAVTDVLFGDHNPAGRLPVSFPHAEGQLPLVYNHKPTGRGDDYLDLTGKPLFPFGFGLSYTTFAYSDLRIDPAELGSGDSARVRLRVRNSGTRAGAEVVQLYLRDLLASVARPVQELAAFQRVMLAPGESRELAFALDPAAFSILDRDLRRVVEPGRFRIQVGASSADIRLRGELEVRP